MTRTKTRALANWPNNTISVLDFGALGDGITDDSAAIQAAVDSLEDVTGGGTIFFPNGSYVVRTQIYTELFNDISKYRRWGISFKGESRLETKILLQNHVGFFEWNCAWTWRKQNRGGAANINFSAKDFTVVLEAHVLGDKLADGEIDYSCGQVFRLLQGGGTNSHWQGVVFENVDIQNYETFDTNPPQRYIPSLGTPPFNDTAKTGNYVRQGLFMRGTIRTTLMNCNWSSSPYGAKVGQDQFFATDAFEGESLDCSINKSTNIITTTKPHNFSIGEPVVLQGNGDQVQYEVLWPVKAQNIKSVQSLSDNKLCYFVSPINFGANTFSLSPDYSCLTAEQANQIPDFEYPDDNPAYCPAVDLVRIPFEGTGTVSCKVIPATSNVFNYCGYGIALHGSAFWGCRFGYREENPFAEGSEGGIVRDSNFTSDTGCFIQSVGVEPGFTIRNTHFNCRTGGLYVIGRKLMDVADNIWYNQMYPPDMNSKSPVDGVTPYYPKAYSDIKLEKVWDSNFSNIIWWWGDRTNRVNVDADSECYGIVVKECKAACKDSILYKAASGTRDMKGLNNIAVSGTTYPVGRIYVGDIAVSHPTSAGGLLQSGGEQTISGATEQEVIWDSTFVYENFGATVDGNSIVIPNDQGINYVRFTASILTTNNADAVRIFVKRVGQNPPVGLSGQESIGAGATNHVCSYSSGLVQVSPREKYSLYVQHSGTNGDIGILQNPATFFAYEVING